jgi:pimeloyl-ACP methyl ester carboxylesterase
MRSSSLLRLAPLLLALAPGCRLQVSQAAEAPAPAPTWVDGSPHLSESVDLDGVRLNYLDWGGVGPALVLVHGLGSNPHVFDDLAPLLRGRMHVLAYARRGHGDSDAPPNGPHDAKALVGDLGKLLDKLHVTRAYLLGWSTAGDELTRFAAAWPDRVSKLVYLDAAYDWSDPTFLAELPKMMAANGAEQGDLASLEAYRRWFADTWLGRQPWTPGLEAALRDRTRVGPDGRVAPRMPGPVQKLSFAALSAPSPSYAAVRASVLALYAASFFPTDSANPGRAWLARDFEDRVAGPWRAASIARLRRELPGATVQQLAGTSHTSIGVHDVRALAGAIDTFLNGAPARAPSARREP